MFRADGVHKPCVDSVYEQNWVRFVESRFGLRARGRDRDLKLQPTTASWALGLVRCTKRTLWRLSAHKRWSGHAIQRNWVRFAKFVVMVVSHRHRSIRFADRPARKVHNIMRPIITARVARPAHRERSTRVKSCRTDSQCGRFLRIFSRGGCTLFESARNCEVTSEPRDDRRFASLNRIQIRRTFVRIPHK